MSQEATWQDVSIKMLGVTLTGLRGFNDNSESDDEALYAAGSEAIDIQQGNIKNEGSITVLKFEQDKLNDAAIAAGFASLIHVPAKLITITRVYQAAGERKLRTTTHIGCKFNKISEGMKQGDKMTECELPYKYLRRRTS